MNKRAILFVVFMGVVSMMADLTYEGLRSISGPYLAFLGASATLIGVVSGIGESLGYILRLPSGYIADKTRAYWLFTILGYMPLLLIPIMGWVENLIVAIMVIILERVGKGVRSPSRDTLIGCVVGRGQRGIAFAIHEFLDQLGAIISPFIFALSLFLYRDYGHGFRFLWIPALGTIILLVVCWILFRTGYFGYGFGAVENKKIDIQENNKNEQGNGDILRVGKVLWLFVFMSGLGNISFPLISLQIKAHYSDYLVPLFYVVAMVVDGLSSLVVGRLYDIVGFRILIIIPVMLVLASVCVFWGGGWGAIMGVVVWGVCMGVVEGPYRAMISDLSNPSRMSSSFGMFYVVHSGGIMLGSAIYGLLYDINPFLIPFVVMGGQVIALIAFWRVLRTYR